MSEAKSIEEKFVQEREIEREREREREREKEREITSVYHRE